MIDYELRIEKPATHLVEVVVRVSATGKQTTFAMPSWTPGSYLLREFARNVQDFSATDATGAALHWTKIAKGRWSVDTRSVTGPVAVRYRVYANELTVRTSHVDSSHAMINGASVFMWVEGLEASEFRITVDAPEDWRVATSLEEAADGSLKGVGYDELVDSPIEIGSHRSLAWEQQGVPHRWAIWPEETIDEERLLDDSRKIVDTCASMFDGLPYDRYLFLLHVVPGGGGGLEHRFSTLLQVAPEQLHGEGYERLLALTAHELFHVWLGKRIRPEPLGPFDYLAENYTRNLWVVEGFTTYYTDRILLRAGLMTKERYLERLGDSISRLQALPGRAHQTLEESSYDAWIRFYRPDAHTPNSQVSYYHKGSLVALALDLEIMRATRGEKSLDDVMRLLWERYGATDAGFPEDRREGIQAIVAEVGGEEVAELLTRYVTTTDEIDFDRHLDAAGLELLPDEEADDGDSSEGDAAQHSTSRPRRSSPPPIYEGIFGIRVSDSGSALRTTHVLGGSPASEAGLNSGDELVAIDGRQASTAVLKRAAELAKAGERVELGVFRRGRLMTLVMEIGAAVTDRWRIAEARDQSAETESIRESWLGRTR